MPPRRRRPLPHCRWHRTLPKWTECAARRTCWSCDLPCVRLLPVVGDHSAVSWTISQVGKNVVVVTVHCHWQNPSRPSIARLSDNAASIRATWTSTPPRDERSPTSQPGLPTQPVEVSTYCPERQREGST